MTQEIIEARPGATKSDVLFYENTKWTFPLTYAETLPTNPV